MQNSNLEPLKKVARQLRPLLSEVVFVGGCTTGLFITDEAAAEVRPTFDVDVIAEITSYADYATFSERLRALSFQEDTSKGAPLCRWLIDEMRLDVMPIDGEKAELFLPSLCRRSPRCLRNIASAKPISVASRWFPVRVHLLECRWDWRRLKALAEVSNKPIAAAIATRSDRCFMRLTRQRDRGSGRRPKRSLRR